MSMSGEDWDKARNVVEPAVDEVAVGIAEVDRRDGPGGVPDRLLLSRGLVFADRLRARPVADFHLYALGAFELDLVGVVRSGVLTCACGFKTPAGLLLVFDRESDVLEPDQLVCRGG